MRKISFGTILAVVLLVFPPLGCPAPGAAGDPDAARLLSLIKAPDALARERAADGLGSVRPTTPPILNALIGALSDEDAYVQGKAAEALSRIGRPAVGPLATALRSVNPDVRWCAAIALGRLGAEASEAVPALTEALADAEANVRWCSAVALGTAGPRAKDAVPVLLALLNDTDEDVRFGASVALARIAPEAVVLSRDPEAVAARIQALVPGLMREFRVPGVQISLVADGGIAWSCAYGVLSASAPGAVTRESLFEACSMSKPVFAYLVLKLVEQGRLDLDRPLALYASDPALAGQPGAELITARMVLAHTTGLPNWRKGGEERGGPVPVRFLPGTRFGYSGEGMYYLQRIVESITGESLDSLARRSLFEPLGLRGMSYVWRKDLDARLASGHKEDGAFLSKTSYRHPNAGYSLYASADDYARFILEILRPDRSAAFSLSRASLDEMLRPQAGLAERDPIERPGAARGFAVYWGLGWSINETPRGPLVHHSGANSSGFRCFSQFDPRRATGIVIMTNGLGGGELWTRLIREVGDL
jgi:CubicO group peptidase (beta-lactamase class C family)